MWYGTFNGLCRNDGYNIRVFRSDLYHPGLLSDNYITYISEDHDKKIWFGTMKGGYILDKATCRITPMDLQECSDKNVFTINVTRDGSIWVSMHGVLFRFKADGTLIKRYKTEYNHSPEFVYIVYEDKNGDLIISLTRGGMYKLNKDTDNFEAYFHHRDYMDIERIIWDETNGYYWLGTWGKGIVRFDPNSKSPETQYIPQPLPVDITGNATGAIYHSKSTQMPDWLAFFSGKRFVAIATGLISIVVSVALLFVWPVIFDALVAIGRGIAGMDGIGAGIYAFLNRLLIPTGLHHALNNVFWFDTIGLGDLSHFWAGETSADVGWSLGMYMSGFFPCMMFGIAGAALAMVRTAKNKKAAIGLVLSAAICAFVCGVTEPFEFGFMFLCFPLYVVYSALYGIFTIITHFEHDREVPERTANSLEIPSIMPAPLFWKAAPSMLTGSNPAYDRRMSAESWAQSFSYKSGN